MDCFAKTIQPIWNSDNLAKNIQTIQPVLHNARFEKKSELELFLGLRSPVGALRQMNLRDLFSGIKKVGNYYLKNYLLEFENWRDQKLISKNLIL